MITKRSIFAVLFLFATLGGYAQQFGVSAAGVVFFQPNRVFETYNGRMINTGSSSAMGVRIEGNYIMHAPFFPVSAYTGLGVTFVAPSTDSTVYTAQFSNGGGGLELVGLQKTSMLNIGLRFGYEIPQQFDEFLIIHAGFGFSFTKITHTNIFPEMPSSTYTQSDFESETFDPVSARGISFEIIVGGVYEFEKFSLIGQYSFLKPWAGIDKEPFRHGPSVGIFLPLYRF